MLALFAAAALAAAPAPAERAAPPAKVVTASPSGRVLFEVQRTPQLREARLCKGAGRMMTAYEPALLYKRQKDDQVRRLIDMPEASACLLGGVDGTSAAIPGEGR